MVETLNLRKSPEDPKSREPYIEDLRSSYIEDLRSSCIEQLSSKPFVDDDEGKRARGWGLTHTEQINQGQPCRRGEGGGKTKI